jgi:WS/DGAT/MGAT family acyltransferase
MTGERLSALEASYLCFERPGRPVHVGAVAVFDGGPLLDGRGRLRLAAVREHVADRVRLIPRLRQRFALPLLGVDRPHWVDDPDFDVAHHVTEVRLPGPGDEAALRRLAEEVHTRPLHPERPPWDLHLVTGLEGGRVGLVERAHHALVDGVGGVDLAAAILDLDPAGGAGIPLLPPDGAEAAEDPSVLRSAAMAPLRASAAALHGVGETVRHPATVARRVGTAVGGLSTVVDEGLLAPRTSLGAETGTRRHLAWLRVRLDDVKAAGRPTGATVNDVVLAAVAAGLRTLLVRRDEPLPHDLVLKALVPVSERDPADGPGLGNHVSAVLAPLPVGVADPAIRLTLVSTAMRHLKERHEASGLHAALRAADLLPMPLVRTLVRGAEHQRFVNLVVTNVPGPPVPLYMLGARMLEAFPVVPLAANLSVGVAILSYDGALTLCLTADADACPDVDVLAAGVARGLDELVAHRTEEVGQ